MTVLGVGDEQQKTEAGRKGEAIGGGGPGGSLRVGGGREWVGEVREGRRRVSGLGLSGFWVGKVDIKCFEFPATISFNR